MLADDNAPRDPTFDGFGIAGSIGRFYNGADDKALEQVALYGKNSGGETHEVGQKQPNDWGLYDMHGNVDEWTASPWKDYAEGTHQVDQATISADLAEPDPRARRVMRGGSFWDDPQLVRSAFRLHRDPWDEFGFQGFRVLLPGAPSGPRDPIY